MSLPETVREELQAVLGAVEAVAPIGGGSISRAYCIRASGDDWFLKVEATPPNAFFEVEAAGLALLRSAETSIRVPRVVRTLDGEGGPGFILMEWLEPISASRTASEDLGRGLARIHRVRSRGWGWDRAGYIGRLPQSNLPRESWWEFWWFERLLPQLTLARGACHLMERDWEGLPSLLPDLLAPAEVEGPSLLHGDLWSGNRLYTARGPALVDPSCYFGHREVDLAMAELFGGFDRAFFDAYSNEWPLTAGRELRKSVYQLYYVLVHVNLFGGSYVSQAREILRLLRTS